MTAHDIIRSMGEVYATCRSYTDSGCVQTAFLDTGSDEDFQQIRPFRTAFVRPDRFRFQYSERERHCPEAVRFIVALNGPRHDEWWDHTELEPNESLSMAIAGATRVSGGSALTRCPRSLCPMTSLGSD